MAIANLTLRFILELAGIAAFGIWGLAASSSPIVAVVAVAAAIVVWALVVAPKTRNGLSQSQKDVVGTAILLVAAVALAAAGNPVAGVVFGLVVVVNAAILARPRPRRPRRLRPDGSPGSTSLEPTDKESDMQLAPGLHRLGDGLVNSYLVEEGGAITIVDAGMSGQYGDLERELAAMGRTKADIRAIVLTHGDTDHVGFADRLRQELGIPVYVHAADVARARGEVKKPGSGWGPMKPGPFLGFMAYGLRKGGLRTKAVTELTRRRRRRDAGPAGIAARHPAAGAHAGQRRRARAVGRRAVPGRRR